MADTFNGWLTVAGDTPLLLTLGPLGSGVVLSSLRTLLNTDTTTTVTIQAALTKNRTQALDNFRAGNTLLDLSSLRAVDKPLAAFSLAAAVLHEFVIAPLIRLPTRPVYVTLRVVSAAEEGQLRVFAEATTLDRDETEVIQRLGRIIQTEGQTPAGLSAVPTVPIG